MSLRAFLKRRISPSGHKIAINMKPKSSPWGGGNQFVNQLATHLRRKGHLVVFRLERGVTCVLLVEPRPFQTTVFGVSEIRDFKLAHPAVLCVHRINECDLRKGTDHVDRLLREANETADFTIFISHWLKNYFVARWFDIGRPHAVIQNGADPRIFHPNLPSDHPGNGTFQLVTHHWSANWNKGFGVYKEVDRMIADGLLPGFGLTVIGRWPKQIRWREAVTHGPSRGKKLASLLRRNHAYLTASLWEPCGMHHIEGAQCGLPLVYHEDGGGIVEFGTRYGVGFRDDVRGALLRARDEYVTLRNKVLRLAPSGHTMCEEYERVLAQ